MKNSRPVYSTETGRIRSDREQPASARARRKGKGPSKAQSPPADGVARIQRETKGRKGKTATLVTGLPVEWPGPESVCQTVEEPLRNRRVRQGRRDRHPGRSPGNAPRGNPEGGLSGQAVRRISNRGAGAYCLTSGRSTVPSGYDHRLGYSFHPAHQTPPPRPPPLKELCLTHTWTPAGKGDAIPALPSSAG